MQAVAMLLGGNCRHKVVCMESLQKFIEYCTRSFIILDITCDEDVPVDGVMYSSCRVCMSFLIYHGVSIVIAREFIVVSMPYLIDQELVRMIDT